MQLDYPQAAATVAVATTTAAAVVSLWPPLSVAPTHTDPTSCGSLRQPHVRRCCRLSIDTCPHITQHWSPV